MDFRRLQVCVVHAPVTMLFGNTRITKDSRCFIFKYCFGVSLQSWLQCLPFVSYPSLTFFFRKGGSHGFPLYGGRSPWQSKGGVAERLLETEAEHRAGQLLMRLVEMTGII